MKTLALERDRESIVMRLRAVKPSDKALWGRMDAHQMICHLADAFRLYLGEKSAAETSTLLQRTLVKWIALYAPLHWPPDVPTPSEINQCEGAGTMPGDFEADQVETIAVLGRYSQETKDGFAHPIFGKLSSAQWLRLGYLHTDHHLRQFGR